MSTVFFITHPDVVIDPGVPVAEWPLNERGRARMQAMKSRSWTRGMRRIFASSDGHGVKRGLSVPGSGIMSSPRVSDADQSAIAERLGGHRYQELDSSS